MLAVNFIEQKKQGKEHKPEDIKAFIDAYVRGDIPDYQVSAWLMAVNFQGMTTHEIVALTDAMLNSGERIDLSQIDKFKTDKHSTGGVGDKVSLILAPLAKAAGCVVPMISGRGLGHSGGTLDKLESIPGFKVGVSCKEFTQLVTENSLAMGSQTKSIVPADRKMYALRDVTATVKSIPLICGSILSKKIAEGINGLVLDVKTGNGAFMEEYSESRKLAETLKQVGEQFGIKVKAVITDMNQPLGNAVGNWLEVVECIDVLKGQGPSDLIEVTLTLTTWMVVMSGIEKNFEKAKDILRELLAKGKAYEEFENMVRAQKGDVEYIKHPENYKQAAVIKEVLAESTGYIKAMDTEQIGMISLNLGGGRKLITDEIVPEVGLIVKKKIGDKVEIGDMLCLIHANSESDFETAKANYLQSLKLDMKPVEPKPLIYESF
ncbi:MAG: thymidine phosphorylase [Candidatus Marinimicrobia bacterium]|nr:thymidine phosphorylase [Candidatus Neomarinimicrobiota bacterium]